VSGSSPLASLGSSSSPIRITLSDLGGTHVVDIRKYYLDKTTNELRPTQKGIAIREDNFTELLAVLSENEAAILDWLRGSISPAAMVGRSNIRQALLSQPTRVSCEEDGYIRGARFFECAHQGCEIKITFAAAHPLSVELGKLEKGGESVGQLIGILVAGLELAREMTSPSSSANSSMVSYAALMMNWGVALKHLLKSQEA
jgi:Transcriptional Coactivator p15 (PC4)